ncbi:RNA polymerase sigma factor [Rhabdobacter roseus]|uniref:RNA polymerase sigma-70 factor (ECF subfamily) n=1 Tax=Rhabdobacter roseus TaxID=1655419 RepID=A0A840TY31_9BACT|nr:sigma-70 family RNA polymerase sigma factor [Rhabdobacter roseus]MBB5284800.1 RNA polymerase sigma-70 factor (ECF subfamily) [Rhabdobacter roseus]
MEVIVKSIQTYSDEELVHLFITTQRNRYFEALYERYADKVYRKCLSLVKEPAKAEDFTHDIFLKLILKLGTFKENARFSTWLYSITYNYCMDQLRVVQKRGEVYGEEEIMTPAEADLDSVFEEDEIELRRLQQAMAQLNTDEKTLLMMKYQDDMSIREIAEVLGVTESAVKMRLLRSRAKLRKRYFETMLFLGLLLSKLLELIKYLIN